MKTTSSVHDIQKIADAITPYLKAGNHILLYGDLGAGKTTLTSAIIKKLTNKDIDVSSPTYSIVQEYNTSIGTICHMDLYRIKDEEELLDIGFEDILYRNTCIIEWPEIGIDYIEDAIIVKITTIDSDKRLYEILEH